MELNLNIHLFLLVHKVKNGVCQESAPGHQVSNICDVFKEKISNNGP